MAQLYYKYGTMNSGKTIEILKVAHNYEEQGKPVVIMTSALDTREGYGVVSSRKKWIFLLLFKNYQKNRTVF